MKDPSDKSLVDLCIAKDPSAWSSFVERFSKLVYWAIKDRLSRWNYHFTEQDVEDIYQDLFTSLWEKNKLAEIKDKVNVSSWLVMVAGNAACDYFRRKKNKEPEINISIFEELPYCRREGEDLMLADALSSSEDDPSRVVSLKELNQVLEVAIGTLSPRERQVITLSFLYGKKHREIAKLLKISINTASTTIRRARARLKQELRKKGVKDF